MGIKEKKLSAFVRFKDEFSVLIAILALDKSKFNGFHLRASFGRSRFCFSFIQRQQCWV